MALFTFVIGIGLVLWSSGRKVTPKKPRSFLDLAALKEMPFVGFCFAIFFIFLAYYVPFFYIPDYAQSSVDASTDFSVYLLAITNAATFPTRIASALAAQKIGAMTTLLICTAASAVVLFGWFGVHSLAGLDVWTIFWGLTAGPLVTLPAAVVPQLSPDPGLIGTRMGMIWLCAAIGKSHLQAESHRATELFVPRSWEIFQIVEISCADMSIGGLIGAPVAGVLNHPFEGDFTGSQGLIGAAMAAATIILLLIWTSGLKSRS